MPNNYPRFQEPILDITGGGLGKPCVITLPTGKTICYVLVNLTVTGSATGAATKTIPLPSWGMGETRFKLGNVNRVRTAAQLFGRKGLNAKYSRNNAGLVQYLQAGAVITATLNGIVFGNEPVLLGSPEDLALQAALANNTATVAKFVLPFVFAEDWRKDANYSGDFFALPTGFSDGTILGVPYLEFDIPAATGAAGTMTAVDKSVSWIYTDAVAKAGTTVKFVKQKIHQKIYAAGKIELGDVFDTKDNLLGFSLLTTSDQIADVLVKLGNRNFRQVTFAENMAANASADGEPMSAMVNRFDFDTDIADDPTVSPLLSLQQKLSVLANFLTANDAPLNCLILADYYGAVEN